MQVVIRKYSGKGSTELIDELEKRKAEIEPLIRAVPGMVSYILARSDAGGYSATVCKDQAGIDESIRVARDWIAKNVGHVSASAPEVSVGKVILHLK